MKSIFLISAFILGFGLQAQVSIGKTTPTNTSCILDFGPISGSYNRGIVLPKVADATTMTATPGTIVFDANTGSYRLYNGTWSTAISGGTTGGAPTANDTGAGVIIGSTTTTATGGALILESSTQAIVLPIANNPALAFSSPPRGLMVYDTATNQIAVYNGVKWTFF